MKGSDSPETRARARDLGHSSRSSERATIVLTTIQAKLGTPITIVAPPGSTGADAALAAGFTPERLDLRLGDQMSAA